MKNKTLSGTIWQSKTLNQKFEVTNDCNQTVKGFDDWRTANFTGKFAHRIGDGKTALVDLIQKPKNYIYDFVLL